MKQILCPKQQCTSCYACVNICPKNCITMTTDSDKQAIYPEINSSQCINCGACSRACPSLHPPEFNNPVKVFAAVCKNSDIYIKSNSGGVAFVLSKMIIENGGVVYACDYGNSLEVIFKRYDSVDELQNSQGSKYLHSHIKSAYTQINSDLNKGLNVLFIALPCQIAGLYGYLNHKKYHNLLTIDLICHGTPDYCVFKGFSEFCLKSSFTNAKRVIFRKGNSYTTQFLDAENQTIIDIPHKQNLYITHFLDGVILRENCYSCKYAQIKRVSDITLGDFWGIEKNALNTDIQYGANCVLINTHKGLEFFNRQTQLFYLTERTLQDVIKNNDQLKSPQSKNKYNNKFVKLSKNGKIIKALKHCNNKKYLFITIRKQIHKNEFVLSVLRKFNFLKDKL